MLVIAAVAFLVQASTEELVYRGYLTKVVFAFVHNPLPALVIPAFVFAMPHLGNVAGSSGFLGLLPYAIMGLTYGWIAYRSGSLWMSAGVHMGSNWFITMFVGNAAEKIPKVSLFATHGDRSGVALTVSSVVQGLVVIALAEMIVRRKHLARSHTLARHAR
jgi:membrane protease YdiL (CAAX protease family)